LKAENDPSPIGKLASQFHNGDTNRAFYWVNQILEAGNGITKFERDILRCVNQEERQKGIEEVQALRELVAERDKFDVLCQQFYKFLEVYAIKELSYCEVFDFVQGERRQVSPARLDGFVRDTAMPSEDFEIVYAAITIPADVFVTDDEHLIRCAASLGLNFPMSAWNFAKGTEYESKVQQVRELRQPRGDE